MLKNSPACGVIPQSELDKTFFGSGKHQIAAAKQLCDGCPIMEQCNDIAISLGDQAWGVFGGKHYKAGVAQ